MALLTARGVEVAFGDRHVLRGCDLEVMEGEKLAFVGPNGCGKSTFLSVLAGTQHPDHGEVATWGTRSFLEQDPRLPGLTVGDAADDALRWHRDLVAAYHRALDADDLRAAQVAQAKLDLHGWDIAHRIDAMLDRLRAPPRDALVANLSGGETRRVALARALLGAPDTLMLDEPTNHLDADTVEWLQAWLIGYRGAVILVTHDRYLLEAVCDRIVEIEDGVCINYPGSYADYLITRAERRALAARSEGRRLEFLAREAEWASRSPAARTSKQKARLKRLEVLQGQGGHRDERAMDLDLRTGMSMSRHVLELIGISKAFDRPLIAGLDLVLTPGQRLGVMGPNGCGKSTLLAILAGTLEPDAGEILRGKRVRVAVLDQHRSGLDPTATVFDAAGDGNDHVKVGDNFVHVVSFLGRFLFTREHLDQKVASLSGGERARLLLARTLLHGANLLLLDEPTNDLDLQTLRVLEEALLAFDGAAVIVTHDRAFLDRVCTRILAFEAPGRAVTYASRTQYLAALSRQAAPAEDVPAAVDSEAKVRSKSAAPRRLSYKERQELDDMPGRIEALEAEQARLEATLSNPETYRDRADDVAELARRLDALPAEIEALYTRWEDLAADA